MVRILRVVSFEKVENGNLIHDIFEFDLDENRKKNGHFGAEINKLFMEALERVVNASFEIKIEKGGN